MRLLEPHELGQSIHRLNLDHHCPFHQEIDAIAAIQLNLIVDKRQGLLLFYPQSSLLQLERQTGFVSRLE
jgi:hypothetical protein